MNTIGNSTVSGDASNMNITVPGPEHGVTSSVVKSATISVVNGDVDIVF